MDLRNTILLLSLFLIVACEGGGEERRSSRGEYYVPDPNYLYFKNTRGRNYVTEEGADKAILWQHDDLFSSEAMLRPVIRDVWLEDQAYLMLTAENATGNSFRLEAGVGEEAWEFVPVSFPLTLAQSRQLRQILGTQRRLRLITPADTLLAFPAAPGRAAAKEVLDDYLRLLD